MGHMAHVGREPRDTHELLGAAIRYANAGGLAVFPLAPRSKKTLISKEEGGNGCLDATIDIDQITAWWGREPFANIGIATGRTADGKTHVVILDVDPGHGGTLDAAAALCGGTIPATKVVLTGGGGWHFYFLLPDELSDDELRNSANSLGKGIDIRAWHGYGVLPPSIHPSGTPYRWQPGAAERPIAPLPLALIEAIRTHQRSGQKAWQQVVDDTGVIAGNRNNALWSMAGKLRREGFDAETLRITLLGINEAKVKPPLDVREVEDIAARAAAKYPAERRIGSGGKEPAGSPLDESGDAITARSRAKPQRRIARADDKTPGPLAPVAAERQLVGILLTEAQLGEEYRAGLLEIAAEGCGPDDLHDNEARLFYRAMYQMEQDEGYLHYPGVLSRVERLAREHFADPWDGSWDAAEAGTRLLKVEVNYDTVLVRDLAATIHEAKKRRRTLALTERARQKVLGADGAEALAAEAVVAEIEQELADLVLEAGEDQDLRSTRGLEGLLEVWKQSGGRRIGPSYVLHKLDEKTLGMQKDDLVVIAARQSVGKTAYALQMAYARALELEQLNLVRPAGAKERAVVFVSLEMPKARIQARLLTMLSDYSQFDLQSGGQHDLLGRRTAEVDWQQVDRHVARIKQLPILIIDASKLATRTNGTRGRSNMVDITGQLYLLRREWDIDLVFVDFLELIGASEAMRRSSRDLQLGEIAWELKRLALRMHIPVVLLSQMNREGEKTSTKVPSMAGIKYSDEVLSYCDVLLMLYRQSYYTERGEALTLAPGEELPHGVVQVLLKKNRNGDVGKATGYFRGPTMSYYDWDPAQQAPVEGPGRVRCAWYSRDYDQQAAEAARRHDDDSGNGNGNGYGLPATTPEQRQAREHLKGRSHNGRQHDGRTPAPGAGGAGKSPQSPYPPRRSRHEELEETRWHRVELDPEDDAEN